MKKNKTLLFLIIFIFQYVCIFSFSKNNNTKIIGYINSYGNEPFTSIGIETIDGKVYKIISDEEIINQLKTKGGIPVELEGQLEKKQTNNDEFVMFKDGVFIVSSWKVAKYVRSRDTTFKPLTRPFLGFVLNPK